MSTHNPAPDQAMRGKPSAWSASRSSACRRGPLARSSRRRRPTSSMSNPSTWWALHPKPPFSAALPDALREEGVVAGRDEVDGDPHQGSLDHPTLLQRLAQRLAAEVPQARPQTDVRGRRVLALQSGDALERTSEWERRPLQQELASEQCTIEL